MIDIPTYQEIQAFVVEQMTNNQWFQTVGFFGVLGIIWQYTKKAPEYIWTRIERKITYTANIEETDEFYSYFENWLNTYHKKSYRNVQVTTTANRTFNSYSKTYSAGNRPDDTDDEEAMEQKRNEKLKFKQFQDLFFIRRGLIVVKIFKGREQLQNASNMNNAFYNHFKISAIFGKRAITRMLKEVLELKLEEDRKKEGKTVGVWTNSGSYWDKEEDFEPKILDNIILPQKHDIVNDIQGFLDSESWYKERGIPYKRGYMFKGKPGNGKTSLAIALARYFKKDLYVLNPSGVKDDELRTLVRSLTKKSILLMEDIDAPFSKERDKKEVDIKFNFSTLLNCIDGVFSKEGVITIFTTNHPELLDEALVRKGRIDLDVEVSNPSNKSMEEYLEIFFGKKVDLNLGEDKYNISMSHVQEICLQNKLTPQGAVRHLRQLILNNPKIKAMKDEIKV